MEQKKMSGKTKLMFFLVIILVPYLWSSGSSKLDSPVESLYWGAGSEGMLIGYACLYVGIVVGLIIYASIYNAQAVDKLKDELERRGESPYALGIAKSSLANWLNAAGLLFVGALAWNFFGCKLLFAVADYFVADDASKAETWFFIGRMLTHAYLLLLAGYILWWMFRQRGMADVFVWNSTHLACYTGKGEPRIRIQALANLTQIKSVAHSSRRGSWTAFTLWDGTEFFGGSKQLEAYGSYKQLGALLDTLPLHK